MATTHQQTPTLDRRERAGSRLRAGLLAGEALTTRVETLHERRGRLVLRALVDLVALSVVANLVLPSGAGWPLRLFPVLSVAAFTIRERYHRRLREGVLDAIPGAAVAVGLAAGLVALADGYVLDERPSLGTLVLLWAGGLATATLTHTAGAALERHLRRDGRLLTPTLVIGAGEVGQVLARRLLHAPELGLRPVGFLDADPDPTARPGEISIPVLGAPDDLERQVRRTGARHVVVAFTSDLDAKLAPVIQRADALGLDVSVVPRFFETVNHRMTYEAVGGLPLLGLRSVHRDDARLHLKHALDRLLAGLMLVACAPLLGAIALGIRLESPGAVLFRQRRVGRDGRVFELWKFRSMMPADPDARFTTARGAAPGGVEGEDRRTRFGVFLRRTSLDELPQLVNVLRGEMSLVGPRPERPEFVELFGGQIHRYGDRHRMKSGITGWAQVHGLRGQTSLRDRIEWDNHYIAHWSLGLDLKILLMTARAAVHSAE